MRRNIRSEDYASRIGGDEFVVFLSNIPSIQAAVDCAERICKQLEQLCVTGTGVQISGSIGIAIAPEDGVSYQELVKSADAKVSRAKANGKNQFAI